MKELGDRIVELVHGPVARDWEIFDRIAEGFALEGHVEPPSIQSGSDLHWYRSVVSQKGLTITYQLEGLDVGFLPTNELAQASYIDANGEAADFVWPVPTVEVFRPSPTPTNTSSPTPSSTPTRVLLPAFLPLIVFDQPCKQESVSLDVVLALDVSS